MQGRRTGRRVERAEASPAPVAQALTVRAAVEDTGPFPARKSPMPLMPATLTRIAFVAGLLLSPVRAYAAGLPSADLSPAKGSAATARTTEPQSVRSAMSALFNACADWPHELPASPEADLALLKRGTPIDAVLCDAIVDPEGRRFPIMMVSLLITAALLGTFAGRSWPALRCSAGCPAASARRCLGLTRFGGHPEAFTRGVHYAQKPPSLFP